MENYVESVLDSPIKIVDQEASPIKPQEPEVIEDVVENVKEEIFVVEIKE